MTIAKMVLSSTRAARSDKAHLPSFTSETSIGNFPEFEHSLSTAVSKWEPLVIGWVTSATDIAAKRVSDVLMEISVDSFRFMQRKSNNSSVSAIRTSRKVKWIDLVSYIAYNRFHRQLQGAYVVTLVWCLIRACEKRKVYRFGYRVFSPNPMCIMWLPVRRFWGFGSVFNIYAYSEYQGVHRLFP